MTRVVESVAMYRRTASRRLLVLTLAVIATLVIAVTAAYLTDRGSGDATGWAGQVDRPAERYASRTDIRTFYSAALQREMPLRIHLPPGYDS